MADVSSFDPEYGWERAVPEPFWVRRWFRWRPSCPQHGLTFRTRPEYDEHYLRNH